MKLQQTFAILLALLMAGLFLPAVFADGSNNSTGDNSTPPVILPPGIPPPGTPPSGMPPSRVDLINERAQIRGNFQNARNQSREQLMQNLSQFRNGTNQTRQDFKNQWGNQTNLTQEQLNQRKQDKLNMNQQLQNERKKIVDDFKARRDQIQQEFKGKMDQLRLQVKQANDQQKALRDRFKDEKDNLNKTREQYNNQCAGNNSANSSVCNQVRQELAQGRKNVLGNAAQQVIDAISVMQARVQTNPNLDNATSSALLSRLTANNASISNAQAIISALTNQSTVNDTKVAADALQSALQDSRVSLKLANGALLNADFMKFLNHLTAISDIFKAKSAQLSATGKNTTQLDAAIAAFDAKISTVSASFSQAQASFMTAMQSVKTESDANAILKSESDQLKAARADAQTASESLKSMIKELQAIDPKALADVSKQILNDSAATDATDVTTEASA